MKNFRQQKIMAVAILTGLTVSVFVLLAVCFAGRAAAFEMYDHRLALGAMLGSEHYCTYEIDRIRFHEMVRDHVPTEKRGRFLRAVVLEEARWLENWGQSEGAALSREIEPYCLDYERALERTGLVK